MSSSGVFAEARGSSSQLVLTAVRSYGKWLPWAPVWPSRKKKKGSRASASGTCFVEAPMECGGQGALLWFRF